MIGREPMSLLRRTKTPTVRECMPACIARKAIKATQSTGMVERVSPFAENRSMRNGLSIVRDLLSTL